MTNAWFLGAAEGVPQHESEVRSTVEPVRDDSQDAESSHAPDWNEFDNDSSGELVGLTPRVAGSDTRDTEKFVPWWSALATQNHSKQINDQVATSGTAAARENAGQAGHGTMQYAQGIEPVIRDGAAYGNDYFSTNPAGANEAAGMYMTPADSDNWVSALAQNSAEARSRKAFQASNLNAFLYQ